MAATSSQRCPEKLDQAAPQEGTGFPQGQGEGDIVLDPLVQGQQGQAQQGGEGGEGHGGASFGEMVVPDSVHAFEGKGKGGYQPPVLFKHRASRRTGD